MLTSDHGEPFGEHGYIRKARPQNHEYLVHIPWIVRHPDGMTGEIDALVQTTDMMPTILDAVGIDGPLVHRYLAPTRAMFPQGMTLAAKEVHMHGFSLLPLMRDEIGAVRRYAVTGHHGRQWSIRDHEWALLVDIDGPPNPQLYHRPTDPDEQHNVIEDNPELAAVMELRLRRWVEDLIQERKGQGSSFT
jgi:arylsulfatase A-like enzyme